MSEERSATDSSKALVTGVVGLISSHIRLFALELEEQKQRTVRQLLLVSMVAISGFLLLLGLSTLAVLALWDHLGIWALVVVCAFYALLFVGCLWRLRSNARNQPSAFADTIEELNKAKEQFLP